MFAQLFIYVIVKVTGWPGMTPVAEADLNMARSPVIRGAIILTGDAVEELLAQLISSRSPVIDAVLLIIVPEATPTPT